MLRRSARRQGFAPYVVEDSGTSIDEVFGQVNAAVWATYGPDLRTGRSERRPIAVPHGSFVRLLEALTSIEHIRFVDHVELLAEPAAPDEVRIALRHDIDSDIVAAVAQAQTEAEFGIRANWVVLHTAAYYGRIDEHGPTFVRNDSMASVYRQLQDLGHEVSIHADPLGLYQFHGVNGSAGFVAELEWLRSHGVDIQGTTAHNNRLSYGAENYEVFTGFIAPLGTGHPADATEVVHEGRRAELRVLDDADLGLVYEGNQPFWDRTPRVHLGTVGSDGRWYWSNRARRYHNARELDQAQLLQEIRSVGRGEDIVLVVHPEYFGMRIGPDAEPTVRPPAPTSGTALGWSSWTPQSVVASDPDAAIHAANDLGMIDVPSRTPSSDALSVVVIGADNIDAAHVPLGAQLNRRLEHLLTDMVGTSVVTKLAHPGATPDDFARWLSYGMDDLGANVVVVAVADAPDDRLGAVRDLLESAATRGAFGVLLVEGTTADRSTADDARRWRELAIELGAAAVEPADALRHDRLVLGVDESGASTLWGPDDHRVVAVQLAQVIAQHAAGGSRTDEQVSALIASPHAALRRSVDPVLQAVDEAVDDERAQQLGLRDWPVPFEAGQAWARTEAAPTRPDVMEEHQLLVVQRGLDHGFGLPLLDHHQRYSRGRRGLSTSSAAVLTHDGRRDKAPLDGKASWLAHVLAWAHQGDLDHLAGISAWGARSLRLDQTRTDGGGTLLTSPGGTHASAEVPYAFNVDQFPIGTLAVEILGGAAPAQARVIGGTCPPSATVRQNEQVVPTVSHLRLASTHALPGGTTLLHYRPEVAPDPLGLNEPERPTSQRTSLHHADLTGFELDVPTTQVVDAALHNVDPDAIDVAVATLASTFGLGFPLAIAPRDHSFYTREGLLAANDRLARVRERQPDGAPIARFGDPGGAAHTTVADAVAGPTSVAGVLRSAGLRFVSANGGLDRTDVDLDSDEDDHTNSNPNVPPAETSPHPRQLIVDGLDRAGAPMVYTERFAPFDREQLDVTAAAHFGWSSPDDAATQPTRRWLTRPSVLVNYAHVHEHIERTAERNGDAITVPTAPAPYAIDHDDQLFGISFDVDDPATAVIRLDDEPVESIIRWPGRAAITVGTCGIRRPIISDMRPIAATVEGGTWTWHTGSAIGHLTPDPSSTARLAIDLGRSQLPGAQVLGVRLQGRGEVEEFVLRLHLEGGATIEASEAPPAAPNSNAPSSNAVGWWRLPSAPSGWDSEHLVIPLWGLAWTAPPPPGMTVRSMEITCAGKDEASLGVADAWLGRPRPLPQAERPEPMLGGSAVGRSTVSGHHRATGAEFQAEVAPDGLWHSGPVAEGTWDVRANGGDPITVQLATPRFDIHLDE